MIDVDLIIRGGTVVNSDGRRAADVLIGGGVIRAVRQGEGGSGGLCAAHGVTRPAATQALRAARFSRSMRATVSAGITYSTRSRQAASWRPLD